MSDTPKDSAEAKPEQPAASAPTKADETREIKTYEDALMHVNAALQNGGDPSVLLPLQTFFKNRIERAPKKEMEHDEASIKKAQLTRRTWKPYSAAPSAEAAPAATLKI